MGHVNPDRQVSPPSPLTAMSLAEIHIAGWQLRASCGRCKTALRVNLPAMIRTHGPDAIIWGTRPHCPGWECDGGELRYAARAIPSGSWVAMTTAPSQRDIEVWKTKRRGADRGPRNT